MISERTQREFSQAIRENDLVRAAEVAEAAIARGEAHEALYSLAGQRRQQLGDGQGAASLFMQAVEMAPDNPAVLAVAGDSLRYTGQLNESVRLFNRALERDPAFVGAWYGQALALEAMGRLDEAERSFARVIQLAPATASGYAGLASLQTQSGRIEEARQNVRDALELGPNESATLLAQARLAIAERRHGEAAEAVDTLLAQPGIPTEVEIAAYELLGDVRDRQDMVDEAFTAYARANSRFAQLHGGPGDASVALGVIEEIARGLALLSPGSLAGPVSGVPQEAARHVFILGYPRSGTTLTEQILATLPDVVTLEEARTFGGAEHLLSASGLAELAALDSPDLDALRRDYWAIVAAAGIDVSGKTFVDMDPLKGAALPLIARLFPEAHVIVVRRDPRDTIWSCFRRNFVFSPVTLEFTTIERAARHYSAVMHLIEVCLQTLPINAFTLRYEDLVADFDATTQAICRFLDLSWAPQMREFGRSARTRTVRTASGPQVRGPLFDGTGQWQKYARYLEPAIPLITQWIAAPDGAGGDGS